MLMNDIHTDSRGDRWVVVGYSSPRRLPSGGVYRMIRERDGARVRIKSNKMFMLSVGRARLDEKLNVRDGTNEMVGGRGAARLEDDQRRADYVLGHVFVGTGI